MADQTNTQNQLHTDLLQILDSSKRIEEVLQRATSNGGVGGGKGDLFERAAEMGAINSLLGTKSGNFGTTLYHQQNYNQLRSEANFQEMSKQVNIASARNSRNFENLFNSIDSIMRGDPYDVQEGIHGRGVQEARQAKVGAGKQASLMQYVQNRDREKSKDRTGAIPGAAKQLSDAIKRDKKGGDGLPGSDTTPGTAPKDPEKEKNKFNVNSALIAAYAGYRTAKSLLGGGTGGNYDNYAMHNQMTQDANDHVVRNTLMGVAAKGFKGLAGGLNLGGLSPLAIFKGSSRMVGSGFGD